MHVKQSWSCWLTREMSYYEIEESVRLLLPATTLRRAPSDLPLPPSPPQAFTRPWLRNHLKKHFYRVYSKSSAIHVILLWNLLVGGTYGIVNGAGIAAGFTVKSANFGLTVTLILAALTILALIQCLFYPVGGLIADIWCGRYRVISLSVFKIWLGNAFLLVFIALIAIGPRSEYEIDRGHNGAPITVSECIILGVALIFFIFGFTGFQANSVQFGLDQLQDASSEQWSVFLHWFVWTDMLGQAMMYSLMTFTPCNKAVLEKIAYLPIPTFVVLTASLLLSCYKRSWFHSEPQTQNPYGTVYRVLRYVARHDRPERPSAETYCDNERPTRMDFAKIRFGGPFATETVEDVKTFLRILVMLFAAGPIYTLHVSLNAIFPIYGLHLGKGGPPSSENCTANWILLKSGTLTYLVTVVCLPLYIVFVLPCKRCLPKRMLSRLGCGLILMVLAALAMFVTHIAGQSYYLNHHPKDAHGRNNLSCMFNSNYRDDHDPPPSPTLMLPWWVYVFPCLLSGVANPLVSITILEFVSAQSPHSMKGLFLGAYYSVRGFFTILGYVVIVPFDRLRVWRELDSRLFDCGVSYLLLNVLLGGAGLLLLLAASRCYKYRQRGDLPYEPWDVEELFRRWINRRWRHLQTVTDTVRSPESNFRASANYGAT